MKRENRMKCAEETVAICEAGFYVAPSGKRVELGAAIKSAVSGTVLYSLKNRPPASERTRESTRIEVINQTTFTGLTWLARVDGGGGHIGCLNFASARNPGGGFLNGSQAQEEALARASALYPSLLQAPQYYERNRANRSAIYLDLVIYSPHVPFFRNDDGALLEQPILASVITAPAPNAGAVHENEPHNARAVEPALRRRAELVLATAHAHGIERLVLGAWGCGVFRNDPALVAGVFADLLTGSGHYAKVFSWVLFAVFDRGEDPQTYRAFRQVIGDHW
jgi:uncharacterized protein (TIGR02452 family)